MKAGASSLAPGGSRKRSAAGEDHHADALRVLGTPKRSPGLGDADRRTLSRQGLGGGFQSGSRGWAPPEPREGHGRTGLRKGERGRQQRPSRAPQTPAPLGAAGQVPPRSRLGPPPAAGWIDRSPVANRTPRGGARRGRAGWVPAQGAIYGAEPAGPGLAQAGAAVDALARWGAPALFAESGR
ncbi:hypothetical protein H8959_011016 [Pygathrix nigripes]